MRRSSLFCLKLNKGANRDRLNLMRVGCVPRFQVASLNPENIIIFDTFEVVSIADLRDDIVRQAA